MLIEGFPSWQVLLVDLRCHGESAAASGGTPATGPHTVSAAARDVLTLLRQLRLFPHMLLGHSFGGKVAMSMVQQFGPRLPRPVQVWVLDTLPGQVRAGSSAARQDHPAELIGTLRSLPEVMASRNSVMDVLAARGFSLPVARWVATNLRPVHSATAAAGLRWTFDLPGISDMYASYEAADLWPLLRSPPEGLRLDFVRAENSSFRWAGADEDGITALGHRVHLLRNSGHWVHSDNPAGLFDILAPSFGAVDLHMRHSEPGMRRR